MIGTEPGGSSVSGPGPALSRLVHRRRWWITLAVLFTLSAAWSLATPLTAAPDEPVQIIKAAAVARGELFGTPAPPTRSGPSAYVAVRVPEVIAQTSSVPGCFMFKPDVPASCAPALRGSSRTVTASTYVGRYPPLYYLIVGLPSLPFPSSAGIRLMRLLSALICCAFVASAFESAVSSSWSRAGVFAVAVSLSPMVLFLSGTVNPNSVEIAAALSLWVSGLVAVTEPGLARSRRLLARVGLAAATLVEMRGISPLWLLLIAVFLLASAHRSVLVGIYKDRVAQAWAGLVAASAAFSLWWMARYDSLTVVPVSVPRPGTSLTSAIEANLGKVDLLVRQMVGVVGWLDTQAPSLTYYVWLGLVAVVSGFALALGSRRRATVLAFVIVSVVALPVAIGVPMFARIGFVWQGRYTLPLAVGVPVLGAFALGGRMPRLRLRPASLVAGAIVAGQGAMFLVALRRYTVGLAGPLNIFRGPWSPPLGAAGVVALFVVGLLAYGAWLVRLSCTSIRGQSAGPSGGGMSIARTTWTFTSFKPPRSRTTRSFLRPRVAPTKRTPAGR